MSSSSTDRRLGLTGGMAIKTPCICATTANITLSGEQTIDSIAAVTGNRVLVKNQTTTTANGIYCVDPSTEILTKAGFKQYADIKNGEDVFTLNLETRTSEWQPVLSVHSFQVQDVEMLSMEGNCHSSLSTLNHRWPVSRRYAPLELFPRKRVANGTFAVRELIADGPYLTIRESHELTSEDYVVLSAKCANLPQTKVYKDAFVELVGWFITEGHIRKNNSGTLSTCVDIVQSSAVNASYVARIKAVLTTLYGEPTVVMRRQRNGERKPEWRSVQATDRMVEFVLNAIAGKYLCDVAPGKVLRADFVASLTEDQLRLFVDTCIAADGHTSIRGGQKMLIQKRLDMLAPVQMACTLLGIGTNVHGHGRDVYTMTLLKRERALPQSNGKRVRYTGTVWCPKTKNSTWLARRNGSVYFTGNTVDSGAWERDLDADGNNDWTGGTFVFVTSGSANGAALFEQTTAGPITIDSDSLAFTKIATLSAGAVTQTIVQNGQYIEVASIAGTNSITGTTVGTAPAALGHGQYVFFVPANTNTGAVTFARDSLTAVNVFYNGAALIGGELVASIPALLFHDGTQYQLMSSALGNMDYRTTGSIASAATLNLNTAKPYSQVTGAVTVTAITLGNGRVRYVEFSSTPLLTNGASLILPTGANITAAAGDTAAFIGEASSVVRCLWYQRANGNTIAGTASTNRGYISGLTYLNGDGAGGGDQTNDITIAAGCAVDSTNSTLMTLSAAITKQLDATWAVGSGAGGLDAGSIGNSDYYIHLIQRTDTNVVDALFSLSPTAPTLPTNYTLSRLIGFIKRVSAAIVILKTYETDGGGIDQRWTTPTLDIDSTALTTARLASAVKVPLNFSTTALLRIFLTSLGGANVVIQCPDETDAAPSITATPLSTFVLAASAGLATQMEVRTSATGTIAARASAAVGTYRVATLGFKWSRR